MIEIFAFKHKNGGYLNKEGGEPCGLCSETLVSYSKDDEEGAVLLTKEQEQLLNRKPCTA